MSQYLIDTQCSNDGFVCSNGGLRVLLTGEKNQTSAKLVSQKFNFKSKRFHPLGTCKPTHTKSKEDKHACTCTRTN